MPEAVGSTIEQELAKLQEEMVRRRAELQDSGRAEEGIPSAKELLRQTIGQQIQAQPAPTPTTTTPQNPGGLMEVQDKVDELVKLALDKSVDEAVKAAVATNNPAIIDAFHDALVDEVHEQMVARKLITEP